VNDHPARAEKAGRPASGNEPNPYAITLAALLATAHVPLADQVEEQPAAPPHDSSGGFDTTGNDGDARATPVATDPHEDSRSFEE
jgi:hypothetical protein